MKSAIIKTVSDRLIQISGVVVLAILLAAAAPAPNSETVVRNTRCPEFQFMASVPFTDAKCNTGSDSLY